MHRRNYKLGYWIGRFLILAFVLGAIVLMLSRNT
jgi:hypothetical protein